MTTTGPVGRHPVPPSPFRRMWAAARGAALLLLVACSAQESNVAQVSFWAMGREGEVVEQLLVEFHRRHPDIRVRVHKLPWKGAHQKLLTAFAADALPDVCQLGNTWVPELAALGALAPLDDRVAASASVAADDFFPGIWDTNVVDGALYGVPWYVDTRLLFYRSDLLERAGFTAPLRDWNEWRRALAAIKAQAGPQRYAILLPLNEFEQLLALALQQDEPLLREDGTRGNFASAGFRRTLDFYLDLFRDGLAPPVTNTQISNVWDEFARGYFAFHLSGPWNIAEFEKRMPADLADAWMTMPLPGPDGPGASNAGGSSLVVFAGSPHAQAAWKLIEYLSEPTVQLRFHALTGNMPPRRSTWADPQLAGDRYAAAFREQLERVEPTPKVPEWERIVTEMQLVAEMAVHGRVDLDGAVREIDRRTDRILEKRRWILARQAAAAEAGASGAAP